MLSAVRFRRFKSFLEAELPLAELTVLVGANASGKSNALEAIQLLSWLAEGRRLHDLIHSVRERELGLRGLPHDLWSRYQDENSFELGCRVATDRGHLELQCRLAMKEDEIHVVAEELDRPDSGSQLPLYRVVEPAPRGLIEVQVEYNNFARGRNKPRVTCIDQQAVFTQLTTPSRFEAQHERSQEEIPEACRRVQAVLTGVRFLEPEPRSMRGYSHIKLRRLDADGGNLSSVLHEICVEQNRASEVLGFVESLPEQRISAIDFIRTERDEVMVRLTENFGDRSRKWDTPLLSDGTLRVLAIAAALLSAPKGTLVVIEEIDNGVHPSRAHDLMQRIRTVSSQRQLRVLLTTHNPALLDSIPDESLPDVVACYRDSGSGDSRLVRLEELPNYPELIAQGPLGQLVTRRIVERTLHAARDRRPLVQRQLTWVDEQE